jgi:hypothetical protein
VERVVASAAAIAAMPYTMCLRPTNTSGGGTAEPITVPADHRLASAARLLHTAVRHNLTGYRADHAMAATIPGPPASDSGWLQQPFRYCFGTGRERLVRLPQVR